MADPRRLSETDGLARQLYQANHSDTAPAEVRARALRLVVGTAAVASTALVAKSVGASLSAPGHATKLAAFVKGVALQATAVQVTVAKAALGVVVAAAGSYGGYVLVTESHVAPESPPTLATPAVSGRTASGRTGVRPVSQGLDTGSEPAVVPPETASTVLAVEDLPLEEPIERPLRPQGETPSSSPFESRGVSAAARIRAESSAGSEAVLVPSAQVPAAQLPTAQLPSAAFPSALPSESTLAGEIELLSRGRSQINSGRDAEARRTLAEYTRRFPEGKLRPEANALLRRLNARGASNPEQ